MPFQVLVLSASDEEDIAERIAERINTFGYATWHTGMVFVGEQFATEVSRQLRENGPVVICGTTRAAGSKWVKKILNAAQGPETSTPVRVFPVRLDAEANLEDLGFHAKIAECHVDFDRGIMELMNSIKKYFPNTAIEDVKCSDLPAVTDFNNWLTSVTDYSVDLLKKYRSDLRPDMREKFSDELDDRTFLSRIRLMRGNRLFASGVLLFNNDPQMLIPKSYIQCVKYSGLNRSDPPENVEIDGSIIDQIEFSVQFLKSRIEKVELLKPGEAQAQIVYRYPMACIREIVANAVCHRDYLDYQRHANVRLFSDRIEVTNPGTWITEELETGAKYSISELESEHVSRNGRLADALRWTRYVETQGSGIPNAVADCNESDAPLPIVEFRQGSVIVTIFPRRHWNRASFGRRGSSEPATFDVLILHDSIDKEAVREISERLWDFGIHPWVDDGPVEIRKLDEIRGKLDDLPVALCIGKRGTSSWLDLSMERLSQPRRLIPVILDGVEELPKSSIGDQFGFIDFRKNAPDPFLQLVRAILATPTDFERSKNVWTVPYRRNSYFVGREEVLEKLHDRLTQDGAAALGQTQAISGLGGIGKTQTAVEYAYRFRSEYQAVFFVRADTEAEILTGFGEMARELDLGEAQEQDQVVAAVLGWLRGNDGWLLIFDNADQPELVKPFLPTHHSGHVLVTSRARVFNSLGITKPFEMETLPPGEALELLLKRADRITPDPAERAAAEALVGELGYLPLALEQAGAYILEKQTRFQDYLPSYRQRGLELLGKGQPQIEGHPEPVATTWELNFSEVDETSPASAEVLRASAFLSPDEIPLEILTQGSSELGPILAEALAEKNDDSLVVDEILEPLTRYSLVSRNVGVRTYSVHRLVQAVVEHSIDPSERQLWAERIVRALNQALPFPEYSNWPIWDRLLPHALTAHRVVTRYSLAMMEAARLLHNAGSYLDDRARYSEAEPLYLSALEITEKVMGKDHPEVAQTLNNLGLLYSTQGRYGEAEPLYQRSQVITEQALGQDHPELAQTLNNLGNLYRDQGRYGEAEPIYQRSLEIMEEALGKDHPEVALTLNNLGNLYRDQGRYGETEPLYRRSLEIKEKALGKNHPEVAQTLMNLGNLYRVQGRYGEAEPLYIQSLEIKEKAVGKDHPEVAQTLNNLGNLYYSQGRYGEAEPLYQRSLEITEKALGKDHPEVALTLNNLGILYSDQGRYEEAEPLYQRSLDIKEKALGQDHPDLATTLNNFGSLYSAQGRYGEAEPFYQRSLEITEKALGNDHPEVASTLNNLGLLYYSQGRYEEAEPLYLRSLEIFKGSLTKGHPRAQLVLKNYSALLRDTGRNAEAMQLPRSDVKVAEHESRVFGERDDTGTGDAGIKQGPRTDSGRRR